MKIMLIAVILGVGLFLAGCIPIFVERRHDRENRNGGQPVYEDHYRANYDSNHDRMDR